MADALYGAQAARAARFVKVAGATRTLDDKALARAESLVGIKGYVTNLPAHLTVVFTAPAVAREAQNCSGMAIRKIVRQLRPLRSATIAINGTQQTFAPEINGPDRDLLDALHGRSSRH